MKRPLLVEFPLVLTGSNAREHHMARSTRVKRERAATQRQLAKAQRPGPLLVVRLTRLAPRTLDPGDNLPTSLKGVRDQVACWLGVDDRTPLVRWEYAQERVSQPRRTPKVDRVRVEVLLAGEHPVDVIEPVPMPEQMSTTQLVVVDASRPRRLTGPSLAALATSASYAPKRRQP